MTTKVCTKCSVEKDISEFHKGKSQCKPCRKKARKKAGKSYYRAADKEKIAAKKKEYYEENKEKIAAKRRKYEAANKEKIAARKKEYYEENKEKIAAQKKEYREANKGKLANKSKKYYEENKEKIAANNKEYRKNNKEKIAAKNKEYREANKEKISEYLKNNRGRYNALNAKRRAAKIQATPLWANIHAIKAIYELSAMMKSLYGVEYHVDHIHPLQSDIVCGLHTVENLRIVEASVNISKGNKLIEDL